MGTERRHLQNIHLTITAIDERKDLRDGRKEKKVKAQREENTVAKCKGDFYGRGLALHSEVRMGEIFDGTRSQQQFA